MKKSLFVFLLLITQYSLLNNNSFPQTGWFQVTTPISNLYLNEIQFPSANTGYAIGPLNSFQKGYLLKTTNGGTNWQSIFIDSLWCFSLYFNDNNTGYIVGSDEFGVIKKTTNGGVNWITQSTDLCVSYFCVYFVDYNTGYAGGKYSIVSKTTNGGMNWFNVSTTIGNWYNNDVYFLNANTGFALGDKINKTTNGGDNWYVCLSVDNSLNSICFVNNFTGYVCGYYGGVVFKTTNSGENWFFLDSLQSGLNSIFFINPNTGFTCPGGYNIFKTTDGGYNWIQNSISNLYGFYSVYFINNYTGFVAGHDGIIMKTTDGGSVFINNYSGKIPENYFLFQNYPNPFNPSTKIKFDIAPLSRGVGGVLTSLKIYDITGREIRTLVNEKLNPGMYEVTFDGSNFASGVYFYQLRSGNFIATKKLILLK